MSTTIDFTELSACRTIDDYHAAWERLAANDPTVPKPGICPDCGRSRGEKSDYIMAVAMVGCIGYPRCDHCCAVGVEKMKEEEAAERSKALAGLIPAEFVRWDEYRGNAALLTKIRGAFNPASRRGLVIHGPTGTCKSRVLWQMIREMIERGAPETWAWVDAFDAASHGFPADATKADLLFIDDIGNEPTSARYEASLLRVIRYRCDRHKPIFITTQLNGAGFRDRFFSAVGADAILRRLRERADFIAS